MRAHESASPIAANLPRRRPKTFICGAFIAVLAACLVAPAVGTANGCSNEGIRSSQGSTALPECRAYEKVSPGAKNDFDAQFGKTKAAVGGGGLFWTSPGAFAGAVAGMDGQYVSSRAADGSWGTHSISPPFSQDQHPINLQSSTYVALAPDLGHGVLLSTPPGVPLSPDPEELLGSQNLYVRDLPAGGYELITNDPPSEVGSPPLYIDSSADYSRNFFGDIGRSFIGAPSFSLYMQEGANLEIASYLPGETAAPEGADVSDETNRAVSRGGDYLYFTAPHSGTGESAGPLYLRHDGETVQVSAPDVGVTPPGAIKANFMTASVDGVRAFFTSCAALTQGATASGECGPETGKPDLYLYDDDLEELSDLTTADPEGGGVLGVLESSEDASTLYFVATGVLDSGAVSGEPNLYVWTRGEGISFIAVLGGYGGSVVFRGNPWKRGTYGKESRVTPDGSTVAYTSAVPPTGGPADDLQVYVYGLGDAEPTCVSCVVPAASGDSSILLQGFSTTTESGAVFDKENLTDDGRLVFFESKAALVEDDVNEALDVYMYATDTGNLSLVSTGRSAEASHFAGAASDGSDAYFTTRERLIGADRDSLVDVYDARIDGGVGEPPPAAPPCVGEGCQEPPLAPPLAMAIGSGQVTTSANVKQQRRKKGQCKKRGKKGKRTAAKCCRRSKKGQTRRCCTNRGKKKCVVKRKRNANHRAVRKGK